MTNNKRLIAFHNAAWQEYLEWQQEDRKTLKKINKLILSIQRDGFDQGIGKPEPLKHDLEGYWSRRIDSYNRLVYQVTEKEIIIIQCRLHY